MTFCTTSLASELYKAASLARILIYCLTETRQLLCQKAAKLQSLSLGGGVTVLPACILLLLLKEAIYSQAAGYQPVMSWYHQPSLTAGCFPKAWMALRVPAQPARGRGMAAERPTLASSARTAARPPPPCRGAGYANRSTTQGSPHRDRDSRGRGLSRAKQTNTMARSAGTVHGNVMSSGRAYHQDPHPDITGDGCAALCSRQ